MEPTEGYVLSCRDGVALVQTFDAVGSAIVTNATIVPDRGGFLMAAAERFAQMLSQPDSYRLGPADRLAPVFEASSGSEPWSSSSASILTTMWSEDPALRQQKIAATAIELIRANKRILLVCPDHQAADAISGVIAQGHEGRWLGL